MTMRTLWLLAVAALVACASAHAQQPVKIGYVATLSGPGAQLGKDVLDAMRLAVRQRGGKLGGVAVEFVVYDDQLKPDIGVTGVSQLMTRDNAKIIVGTIFSNVLMAIARPVVENNGILISPNAGPSPLAGKDCHPNIFSVAFQNEEIYEPVGKYMTEKGIKRVSVLAPNYQAGRDAISGFKRTFKGEIVQEIYTGITQLDFASELTQLRAAKPDAVFVFYPGGLAINFVKQFSDAGLKRLIPLYSGFALVDATVRPAQGDAALGIETAGNWSPDLPVEANRAFVIDYRKAYSREPSDYAAFGYDTALLLDSALSAVRGDISDIAKLRAALRKADFRSVRGNFKFGSNQFPVQDWYMREVVKGPSGEATLALRSKVFSAKGDDAARLCTMP
jgi:branched-chain amino acid transport system substrate-binding protein